MCDERKQIVNEDLSKDDELIYAEELEALRRQSDDENTFEWLKNGFLRLKPKEKEIMSMRLGLKGEKPKTLQEIAGHYGMTRERVRQVVVKMLRRGCCIRKNRELKHFLSSIMS